MRDFWQCRAWAVRHISLPEVYGVFECRLCNRIKKFGEWIDASLEFRELVRETGVEVMHVVCPHCGEWFYS